MRKAEEYISRNVMIKTTNLRILNGKVRLVLNQISVLLFNFRNKNFYKVCLFVIDQKEHSSTFDKK